MQPSVRQHSSISLKLSLTIMGNIEDSRCYVVMCAVQGTDHFSSILSDGS